MKLLLKSINRENNKIVFKNGRELEVEYIDKDNQYKLNDDELLITIVGNHPINLLEEYGNKVYELYLKYYNKNSNDYLGKKINELVEKFHNL